MKPVVTLVLAVSLVLSVCGGLYVTVAAYESRVKQDIFTADCTSTTTHTGTGTTTAYGCPEAPTIESVLRIMAGERVVFEGWFDVLNMQALSISFAGAYSYEYEYERDTELTLVGDRWTLQIGGLRPGTYTMTVRMLATNGETVATSRQVIVQADHTIVAPGIVQEASGTGVSPLGVSQVGQVARDEGRPTDSSASGASGSSDGRTTNDSFPLLLEQLRRAVVSYASPTLVLAFVASVLVCGYIFYLLGRHYRRLDEQRRRKAKALKRAASGRRKPRRRTTLRHAVHKPKRSHT